MGGFQLHFCHSGTILKDSNASRTTTSTDTEVSVQEISRKISVRYFFACMLQSSVGMWDCKVIRPESESRHHAIRAEAEAAAGPTASFRARAKGYLDIHAASRGTCRFALIAAHGALWASWYLICAKLAAVVLAIVDFRCDLPRVTRYRQLAGYVLALKDINKLVMVESYVLIHVVRELGPEFAATKDFPEDLVRDYAVAMSSPIYDEAMLRDIYHRHFLWEQERVVSTRLDDAFAELTWPLMKNLCERPWIWFSYFRVGKSMNFKRFTDQTERVEKGLIAYDRAVAFGVDKLVRISAIRCEDPAWHSAILLRFTMPPSHCLSVRFACGDHTICRQTGNLSI